MSDGIYPAPVLFGALAIVGLLAFTLAVGAILWPYINGKGTHKRDRAPLFRSQDGALDWQAAEPLPPLPPFPGDEPRVIACLPAPVTAPLHPSAVLTPAEVGRAAEDSLWDRHAVRDVWALLRAEEAEEALS